MARCGCWVLLGWELSATSDACRPARLQRASMMVRKRQPPQLSELERTTRVPVSRRSASGRALLALDLPRPTLWQLQSSILSSRACLWMWLTGCQLLRGLCNCVWVTWCVPRTAPHNERLHGRNPTLTFLRGGVFLLPPWHSTSSLGARRRAAPASPRACLRSSMAVTSGATEDASTANASSSSGKSPLHTKVVVHPIVLLSVVDHCASPTPAAGAPHAWSF